MSAINDLLNQVSDSELRKKLEEEINRTIKNKKYGIVFEEHLPECTPLFNVKIKCGSKVAKKNSKINDVYKVVKLCDEMATCVKRETAEIEEIPLNDLVCIAEFGDVIYPNLIKIDSVENNPGDSLWHTLIEADNYHSLQLLEYLYPKKIDCIYIDPPYNTGAKDWKYNNDYVDSKDAYRHSKWLSMMEKRLKIAKRLLKPDDSILMITIDDIELCSLRLLLDNLFPECTIQIVDMFINPKGKARKGRLSQVDEYLVLVYVGGATTCPEQNNDIGEEIRWPYLRRSDVESARGTTKGGIQQFYPIYVNEKTNKIVEIGNPLLPDQPLSDAKKIEGAVAVFPIREDGKHMNWGLIGESLKYALSYGCVRVTKSRNNYQLYNFTYVTMPSIKKAIRGEYIFSGTREDGTSIVTLPNGTEHQKPTAWKETHYDANIYGTQLIGAMLGEKRFSFPKSIYSVLDALNIYLANKPEALVLDFFAGSGTTLHAINLLNFIDTGKRRCIMVTNNEVSIEENEKLTEQGYCQGDPKWEKLGIARYVTWPRTVCTITGYDVKGNPLDGNYSVNREEYASEKVIILDENGKQKSKTIYFKKKVPVYPMLSELKLSDGFSTNAIYFKLGFLDKNEVALGRQFRKLLPILWMKSGSVGKCPEITENEIPNMMILQENKFAVLVNESYYMEFEQELEKNSEIETVFVVTDSEAGYREIASKLKIKNTYQLYRDYLDNFRINSRR